MNCEFCARAREISKDIDGHSLVQKCRTCFRRDAKKEAQNKALQKQREQKAKAL
jgi:hypothetical protein